MKIALVQLNSRFKLEYTSHAHAGLAYLGAYALNKGHDVNAIDARYESIDNNEVLRRILKFNPDILGITAKTPDIMVSEELAAIVKSKIGCTKIIIGGAHVTGLQERVLKECAYFDVGVIGEGEETFRDLLETFEKNRNEFNSLKGIIYRDNGDIIKTPLREKIVDLDSLLFPAWELFPPGTDKSLFTSRGCPFKCIFCQRVMGQKVRVMSPERVVAEMLRNIEKFNCTFFQIEDEVFGVNKKWIHKTLDLMIDSEIHKKAKWAANARVNFADLEVYQKMKQAGCVALTFGIESGNQDILDFDQKGFALDQAVKAVDMAKKARLIVGTFFILGHPYETRKTVRDTINYAVKLNPDDLCFGLMIPYPGTKIYEMAKKGEGGYKGFHENWELYTKYFGKGLELVGISRSRLNRYQKQAYVEYYMRNFRFKDFFKFIFRYLRLRLGNIVPIFLIFRKPPLKV